MATVIGVRFKKAGKVYYFDPNEIWPRPGDNVVVETARGMEFGEVVTGARSVSDEQIVAPLRKVVRIATDEDVRRAENNERRERDAMRICQEKIAKHKLEMKLVSVEYTFDNSKLIFYFTANGRVDFRELVKDLAGVFKMRIELRQIGVRDEAKMLGGLGSCGRQICCGAFLGDFQPVSIKMAKEQNLSLNPTKISGLCGRLMCCLKYEQDAYESVLKRLPKVGKDIVTPDGVGVIAEINCVRERVKVRIRTADDTFDVREYSIDEVRRPGADDPAAIREQRKPQERRGAGKAAAQPEEEAEETSKRRRYPHQKKAPKNLSTDQFLEKLREDGRTAEAALPTAEKEPHKRRRRGKGRAQEEGAQAVPEAQAALPRERSARDGGKRGRAGAPEAVKVEGEAAALTSLPAAEGGAVEVFVERRVTLTVPDSQPSAETAAPREGEAREPGGARRAGGRETRESGGARRSEGRETREFGGVRRAGGREAYEPGRSCRAGGRETRESGGARRAEGREVRESGGARRAEGRETREFGGVRRAEVGKNGSAGSACAGNGYRDVGRLTHAAASLMLNLTK